METPKYFKVTNETECHRGFQYVDGLNELQEPFNNDNRESCVGGRLYFTKKKYITRFLRYGCWLREVYLPEDDIEFRMIKDPEGDKYGGNKIIFGERYPLSDPATYEKFNITADYYIANYALENNHENLYLWCYEKGIKTLDIINNACSKGWISVLEKMNQDSKINFKSYHIMEAVMNNQINILNFIKQNAIKFKYNQDTINYIMKNSLVDVLQWFYDNGLEIKYSDKVVETICLDPEVKVLKWFSNHPDIKFKYPKNIMSYCCERYGATKNAMKWFIENYSHEISFYHQDIDIMHKYDCTEMLDLLGQYNGEIKFVYSKNAIYYAAVYNQRSVLEWWLNNCDILEIKYEPAEIINRLIKDSNVEMLEWWLNSSFEFSYNVIDVRMAIINNVLNKGDFQLRNWWYSHIKPCFFEQIMLVYEYMFVSLLYLLLSNVIKHKNECTHWFSTSIITIIQILLLILIFFVSAPELFMYMTLQIVEISTVQIYKSDRIPLIKID